MDSSLSRVTALAPIPLSSILLGKLLCSSQGLILIKFNGVNHHFPDNSPKIFKKSDL